ncbi:hypothetical protein [Jeotgalibacillus proteolyticus]|uniref:ABC transporter permease n=1 Tax=Jeotgalibacillus proteolyticus TaxID=2082395 RepID=A0A2S5GDM3_9BACL|nr:hypothetical protein [Jeotgalibacillus proteolyticus]PPA71096.1 hypothetical protein C4B60_09995 [Jeotgalibacillus proteolyticus]
METLRKAFWLARFEFNVSKIHYLILIPMIGIYAVFFNLTMDTYLEDNLFLVDILLIVYLYTISFMGKPKGLQYQKMDASFYASPYFTMLNQLPIKHKVLAASRFFSPYFAVFLGMVLVLISTYILSTELREAIAPLPFISLIFIWLCISFSLGGQFPASEPGHQIKRFTLFWSYVIIFLFFILLYLIFQLWLGIGLFNWTITLANEYPILSIIVSILGSGLMMFYWFRYSLKQIQKNDYLQ